MDLRGYEFNTASNKTGGNRLAALGLHAYHPITSGLNLHLFAQSGSVFNELQKREFNRHLKSSVGVGLAANFSGISLEANVIKASDRDMRFGVGFGFSSL